MLPNSNILQTGIEEKTYSNRTYKIDNNFSRISGYADGLQSVVQAIYLILNTERYKYPIYSWEYGIELIDLYCKPMSYVMSELPRRVEEALKVDDRIKEVGNFVFETEGAKVHATFDVTTDYGVVQADTAVGGNMTSYASDPTIANMTEGGLLHFNVPAFNNDGTLTLNRLPYVNDNGTLIFD